MSGSSKRYPQELRERAVRMVAEVRGEHGSQWAAVESVADKLGMHAAPAEFRSGWFVESLATQTLVIFVIRTRRVPFFRSRPSLPITLAALGVVAIGAVLPATPVAHTLGFSPLPVAFFAALAAMVIGYLVTIEIAKLIFYHAAATRAPARRNFSATRPLRRRAGRFSTASRHRHLPRRASIAR